MCLGSSLAIDLIYNVISSTDKTLRDKEYDNLINLYHKSLCDTVKLLKRNPKKTFSLDDLSNDLKRCRNFSLITTPMIMKYQV